MNEVQQTDAATNAVVVNKVTNTARVFILQAEQNVDITSAIEYGPLIPLFKPNEPKESRPSIWREEFVDEVIKRMEDNNFDPQRDYILVAGSTASLIIWITNIMREWPEAESETIKFLMWNGRDEQYILVEV